MANPTFNAGSPGLPIGTPLYVSSASIPSPLVSTFTLDSPGVYLVTAMGSANGGNDHVAVSNWIVTWSGDVTNDLKNSQQLGVTAKSTGSSLAGDVILSAPDATGVVTVTTSWAGGANNTPRVAVRMRRLSQFSLV